MRGGGGGGQASFKVWRRSLHKRGAFLTGRFPCWNKASANGPIRTKVSSKQAERKVNKPGDREQISKHQTAEMEILSADSNLVLLKSRLVRLVKRS